jgi:hypothetical protein
MNGRRAPSLANTPFSNLLQEIHHTLLNNDKPRSLKERRVAAGEPPPQRAPDVLCARDRKVQQKYLTNLSESERDMIMLFPQRTQSGCVIWPTAAAANICVQVLYRGNVCGVASYKYTLRWLRLILLKVCGWEWIVLTDRKVLQGKISDV